MKIFQNKKAVTPESWLIGAVILIIGFIIVFGIQQTLFSQVNEKTAYDICRGSIAIKKEYTTASPALCKTFEKTITPPAGKTTEEQKEYISEEIAKLAALCWYETGSGMVTDIWRSLGLKSNKCFNCFIFAIAPKKPLTTKDMITTTRLKNTFFSKSYLPSREDDNCAQTGGGFCIKGTSCNDPNHSDLTKQVKSSVCKSGEVCCTATDIRNNCVNFGGKCVLNKCDTLSEYKNEAEWTCPGTYEKCCVTDRTAITYLEYIQEYEGRGNIILKNDLSMGKEYVIALIDPSLDWTGGVLVKGYQFLGLLPEEEMKQVYQNAIIISDFDSLNKVCDTLV